MRPARRCLLIGACIARDHLFARTTRKAYQITDVPSKIAAASRCNLLEEPEAGLEVSDGIAALTLRPFELVTLRLTRR